MYDPDPTKDKDPKDELSDEELDQAAGGTPEEPPNL